MKSNPGRRRGLHIPVFPWQSLFSRLLISYLAITLTILLAAGGLLNYLVRQYVFEARAQELAAKGREIARLAEELARGEHSYRDIRPLLNDLENLLDARIWVVNRQGLVLAASAGRIRLPYGRDWQGRRLSPEDIREILEGKTVYRLGPRYDGPALSVAVPIGEPGQPVLGAVFLHAPLGSLLGRAAEVRRLFLLASVFALSLALAVALLLSRSISGPIKGMTRAAWALARGDFSHRLEGPAGGELGELVRALNLAAEELAALDRMRRDFVANVSHELRRPLTRLMSGVEAVADGIVREPEEVSTLMISCKEEIMGMARMVEDLLELAQLQSGHVSLRLEAVDLGALARRVLRKMEGEAARQNVDLVMAIPESLPSLRADPDRLEQVLNNLLENALRFTSAGGKVTLAASARGNEIQVEVRDTGTGIPPEDLPRVWERFYKVDRSRAGKGSGLGLPIVKELVERQGGKVGVQSNPGVGSTFYFTLPAYGTH